MKRELVPRKETSQIGGVGKKVYFHPLFHEHDIRPGSAVGGGTPLHVLLPDCCLLLLSLPR